MKSHNIVDNIKKRTRIIKIVRAFFDNMDFLEVDTPLIVRYPGMEPYLNPFKIELYDVYGNVHDAYLITSPEYAMKKLLVAGCEKIYQLGKSFRNTEAWGGYHNPEFTMLEWYRVGGDYNTMIDDTLSLLRAVSLELFGSLKVVYQGHEFDLQDVDYCSVHEAFRRYLSLDLNDILEIDSMRKACDALGVTVTDNDSWDDLFFKIFLTYIEPSLGVDRLTVLMDYPVQLAALARRKENDYRYAERVELYIGGMELSNGYSELTDPKEQRDRFICDQKIRKSLEKEVFPIDESFMDALELGMPSSGGNALGVDRLIMFFTDSKNIDDVIAFPIAKLFDK